MRSTLDRFSSQTLDYLACLGVTTWSPRGKMKAELQMPLQEIIQAAKVLADDLKAATEFIGSLTTFWVVAKSTIRMFGREKTYAF